MTNGFRTRSNTIERRNTGTLHHCLLPLEKIEARGIYMQEYDEINDSEGIRSSEVVAISTQTGTEHNEHLKLAQEFIYKLARENNYRQLSATFGRPARRFITTGIDFWFALHPSMGQYKKLFLRHYNSAFYITGIIQHWQDIWVKSICTTVWE